MTLPAASLVLSGSLCCGTGRPGLNGRLRCVLIEYDRDLLPDGRRDYVTILHELHLDDLVLGEENSLT